MRTPPATAESDLNLKHRLGPALVHPLTIFCGIWLTALGMYALHLSELLVFSTSEAARVVEWILIPFCITWFCASLFWRLAPKRASRHVRINLRDPDTLAAIEARVNRWFWYWVALTTAEVIAGRGVPLLWLLQGADKDYTEFGLPVIHVLATSLLAVIALVKFGLWIVHGDKRRLLIPAFEVFWGFVILSRGLIIAAVLQYILLWICLKGVRIKSLIRVATIGVVVVLLFGYLGDIRGSQSFRALARPTRNYPEWLPSGVLWLYIYSSSPLQNLVQTTVTTKPADDLFFPRTLMDVYPTPIRNAFLGKDFAAEQATGDLIAESFNVSSAYIGPYRDYGELGMAAYSGILALAAFATRKRRHRTFRDQVIYALIAECLILTIFWNYLFYNAFAGQFFWAFFLLRSGRFRLPSRLSYRSSSLTSGTIGIEHTGGVP